MDATDVVGWILAAACLAGGLTYWRHMRARTRMQRAEKQTAAEMDPRARLAALDQQAQP